MNFGELFEVEHQRERDGIERAIRLATTREVDMYNTISKSDLAVACETVEHERESLVAFDITRTLEVFIENGADQIL